MESTGIPGSSSLQNCNVMKRILTILLLSFIALYGSSQDKRNKERDIKTTDLYLYGEATADTQEEATSLAKKILASRVYDFEPGLINNSDALEQAIGKSEHYISMPRGIKFRTIAFMLKTEVQELAKNAALTTAGLPAPTNEDSSRSLPAKAEKQEGPPTTVVAVTPPEEGKVQSPEPVIQRKSLTEVEQEKQAEEQKQAEAVQPEAIPAENQVQASTGNESGHVEIRKTFSSGEDLLQYILTIDDARILQKLFDEQKRKGMMIYGGKSTLSFPDKCYLVVYSRDGVVKAYLDKGRVTRKNLLTGAMESLNSYENEPFIWFQLMN